MEHPRIRTLVEAVVSAAHASEPPYFDRDGKVPVSHYTDPARLAKERRELFLRLPIPLASSSELVGAGSMIVRNLASISLILLRDEEGKVQGFRNACRHRATRLISEDCRAKALVCPYHGWTYSLDGSLFHIPHAKAFPGLSMADHHLGRARVEERHGLVWVSLDETGPSVADHLGDADEEIAALSLPTHSIGSRVASEQRGNWKMLMEAFLEGYHIKKLHRTTIYPFFLDARSLAERIGPHVRHASARKAASMERDPSSISRPLREVATYAYVIFPCMTLILHPDWTSLIVVQPLSTDRFSWSHTQLLPELPSDDSAREHFARSFSLIEENVFGGEDLFAIREMQAGVETGANEWLTFGRLETPALWLHDAIDEYLKED